MGPRPMDLIGGLHDDPEHFTVGRGVGVPVAASQWVVVLVRVARHAACHPNFSLLKAPMHGEIFSSGRGNGIPF